MANLQSLLANDGIAEVPSPFSNELHGRINTAVDLLFQGRKDIARAYVDCEELAKLGLLVPILDAVRDLALSIIPDPSLYHCHIYETAGGSDKPHIFGEALAGWHSDSDSEYDGSKATHVSIFIHMTDVGVDNGGFEFCPGTPGKWLTSSSPIVSVTGPKNYAYVWNRASLHRASPNRSPTRRRMLKISLQPANSHNPRHNHPTFVAVRALLAPADPFIDMMIGRGIGRQVAIAPARQVAGQPLSATGKLDVSNLEILKSAVRKRLALARQVLRRRNREAASPLHG